MAVAITTSMPVPEIAATAAGPTRKPGNLWTVEAREDMFNRRESGEGWETICQDYPNRSRHAMQQQYSMMKKQRALENGTWTMNRRGRKRRMLTPDRLRGLGGLSDDDMSDGSPERSHTMRLPPFSHIAGRTQPSFFRSTTDPLFPRHLPALNTTTGGPSSDASSSLSPIPSMSSPDSKRQKLSDDRPESSHLYKSYDPWHPKLPELAFTESDVASLIQKGRDQAARIVEDMNHRKEAMRKSKDEQISKYITQLRETQDQLAIQKGQGPYAQELNRKDREIDSLRAHVAALQETLIARDTKIVHLERESIELKSKFMELGKRDDGAKIGANSPPSTPVTCGPTTPGKLVSWEEAVGELSTQIDAASTCVKSMRIGLDKASFSQIFKNIDELDLVMALVVRDRDKAMATFNLLRTKDEPIKR